ncbi:MAG: tetratricopeptide repeat protein [Pseudomonadota bacterium]
MPVPAATAWFQTILLSLLVLSPPALAEPKSETPYPLKKGTRWTYVTETGATRIALVEGFTQLKLGSTVLPAAVLRRTDGRDRLVIRTETQWIECGLIDPVAQQVDCEHPLVFFTWPLREGVRWSGADLDFFVEGTDPVDLPAGKFDHAWRIAYMPPGGQDPLGEIWMAEGIGPIWIREHLTEYKLTKFEPGSGPDLPAVSRSSASVLLERVPSPALPLRDRVIRFVSGYLRDAGWVWIGFALFLLVLAGTGIGLVRSLGKRGSTESIGATEIRPDDRDAVSALIRTGSLEQATRDLEKLVKENPGYPDLHYQLAQLQKATERPSEARKSLEEALRLNGNYTEARLDLGRLLMDAGEPVAAARELTIAAEQHPSYADVHFERGRALFESREFAAAATAFERTLEINPAFADARQLLTECRETAQPDPKAGNRPGGGDKNVQG